MNFDIENWLWKSNFGTFWHLPITPILKIQQFSLDFFQVMLQLLFITDAQRRRIHSNDHNSSKPGRQVVTFLLICNITMWIIYTFEVQKVKDSPVQVKFVIQFFQSVLSWGPEQKSKWQKVSICKCEFVLKFPVENFLTFVYIQANLIETNSWTCNLLTGKFIS